MELQGDNAWRFAGILMKCEGQGLGKLHRDLLAEASVVYQLKQAVVRSERV